MSLKCTQGFIVSEIKSRRIKSEDSKKYGISEAEWKHADADKNGEIDGSEFIKSGLNSLKIFQAFKGLAGDSYNEKFKNGTFNNKNEALTFNKTGNKGGIQNSQMAQTPINTQNGQGAGRITRPQIQRAGKKGKQEPFKDMAKSIFSFKGNNEYSLIHPNISGNNQIAKKFDFLA